MTIHLSLEIALNTESARKIKHIAEDVGAFQRGEFVLSSGQKSNRYFEGKRITSAPEGAYWVGKAIFDEIVDADVDAVGGLATGAYPIGAAVALVSHLEGKPVPWFVVREPKGHGTNRKIEGHLLTEGDRVVIVDDVMTTGGSVLKAIEAVEAANCEVIKVIVIVDRHEGGSDRLRKDGYTFDSILHFDASGDVTLTATKEEVLSN